MPTPAYLTIVGATQGPITQNALTPESVGNIWQEAHKNEILVQAFNHEVLLPTDPQSGQPTGPRVHQKLSITKVFDKTSPLLYEALTRGEQLPVCLIKWYRTTQAGTQEHYFTMKLEDAIVVDIKAYMYTCQDPANGPFTHLEDVSFSYRKITWTHEVAGTEGSDDWRVPQI
jgi:type VI secretion system secreted protein Hcp